MCEVVTILERELNNTGLVYIYQENDGNWYAYEQSAFYLSQMMSGLTFGRYVMDDTLWLARVQVDIARIPTQFVICYSSKEYVLHYNPHNGFHEWLTEIKE